MQIGIIANLAIAPRPPPEFHVDSWSPRRPGCGPETGFEEIDRISNEKHRMGRPQQGREEHGISQKLTRIGSFSPNCRELSASLRRISGYLFLGGLYRDALLFGCRFVPTALQGVPVCGPHRPKKPPVDSHSDLYPLFIDAFLSLISES